MKKVEVMDAVDGSKHSITLQRLIAVVEGFRPLCSVIPPLRFSMIWYNTPKGEVKLARVKKGWARMTYEIMGEDTCPPSLKGQFEFCGASIFRRIKE